MKLQAEPRDIVGKKVRSLRSTGLVPAVLYGHNLKNQNLSVDLKIFEKTFQEVGESSLLELEVGSKKHNVLIHDLARDPVNDKILHVDFYEVRMDEKIKSHVPLVFIGESNAVKADGGVLVRAIQEIEIEAFPQDLPKEIEVDISSLNTFEDKIHLKDLKISDKIKILTDPEEMVVLVMPPRSEKELEELEVKSIEEVGEVKVVGEEEKAAEGETPTEQAPEQK